MKVVSRIINIILYIIVIVSLLAGFGSVITKKPTIMSAVRSNSMYPYFERGDLIFIKRINTKDTVNIGDIIVFNPKEGSLDSKGWIVHRIVNGNEQTGYTTKGDANEYTDQNSSTTPKIKKEWIGAKVVTIGNYPLKIRFLGYLPLSMEKYQKNPLLLPGIIVLLALIIGISELFSEKKKKKKGKLNLQLIYIVSGLVISVLAAVTMLSTSNRLILNYEVSNNSKGVIMGSNVGIIQVGDKVEKPLSELNNKGFFPIISTIISDDNQLSFSHQNLKLNPGQNIKTKLKVDAKKIGKYKSSIWIGMFYPFLPKKIIYHLAKINYWIALIAVSIIPGLPIMIYPLFDRKMRKGIIKSIRKTRFGICNFF